MCLELFFAADAGLCVLDTFLGDLQGIAFKTKAGAALYRLKWIAGLFHQKNLTCKHVLSCTG